MNKFLRNLEDLLFPRRCLVCEAQLLRIEELICISCFHHLPFTDFFSEPENEMERVFHGRCRIEHAGALLYYQKKGPSQELIHHLKYKGMPEIGGFLAKIMVEKIRSSGRFKKPEAIIPVPLHPGRLKKRGYNQLSMVGKVLSEELQIPFMEDVLIRKGSEISQTHKNRTERMHLIGKAFELKDPERIKTKHILLIDDVLTTGATLESCYNTLIRAGDLKVSFATLAYTPSKLL